MIVLICIFYVIIGVPIFVLFRDHIKVYKNEEPDDDYENEFLAFLIALFWPFGIVVFFMLKGFIKYYEFIVQIMNKRKNDQ